jgi:hypothetical protein
VFIYLVEVSESRPVELRCFGDGCGMMDGRRTVLLSGVMVAFMAGLARSMF